LFRELLATAASREEHGPADQRGSVMERIEGSERFRLRGIGSDDSIAALAEREKGVARTAAGDPPDGECTVLSWQFDAIIEVVQRENVIGTRARHRLSMVAANASGGRNERANQSARENSA